MHPTPVRPRRILFVAWLPLAALAVVLATIPDATQVPTPRVSVDVATPAGASALRVQIDPETGTLVPATTPLPLGKAPGLEAALSRSDEGLVRVYMPNGSSRVNLEGRFQNASVVHLADDGQLHTRCTEHQHEAEAHLTSCTYSAPASDWEVK